MVRPTSAPSLPEPQGSAVNQGGAATPRITMVSSSPTAGSPAADAQSRVTADPQSRVQGVDARSDHPSPATPAESLDPQPTIRRDGGRLFARDCAELPERCVCCADTVELTPLRTILGRVRYHVCREHLIGGIAKGLVGLIVLLLAAWKLAGPPLDGQFPRRGEILVFFPLLMAGLAMVTWAVPLHAGPARGGWRRLYGVHRSLKNDAER